MLVEDSPPRQEILKRLFRDHAWLLTHTAERANILLRAYRFDVVCLDHDLAGPRKGDQVAVVVAETQPTARVILHSMNAPGRAKMAALLPDALALPISRMTKTNAHFRALREALKDGLSFDWGFATRTP